MDINAHTSQSDTPSAGYYPLPQHENQLNLTFSEESHPYLPPLVRGEFLSGCFVGIVNIPWKDSWLCAAAVPCGPPHLLPPCPVTQLRTGPGLFRDVLIKQHGEPESRTACRDRDHDSVLQYLHRGCYLAGNMAAPAKNKRVFETVSVCAGLLMWSCTLRGDIIIPI